MKDYIKLKEKSEIVRLGIMDEEGNIVKDENGKEVCLEFDFGDIDLTLKYNKCVKMIEDARRNLKNQIVIINKKKDYKRKNQLLSVNEEEKVKAIKKYYKDTEEAMDLFLGQGGTKKFLNGRKPYWEMFDDLSEAIKPYMSKFNASITEMTERIKNKYKVQEKQGEILTNE